MSKLYSAATRGFYDKEVHAEQHIPGDVVEISDEEWNALLVAQGEGKVIQPGANGKPEAVDPPASNFALVRVRARNALLEETDGLVQRHRDELEAKGPTTLTAGQYAALQAWRKDLRNITSVPGFPNVQFPPRPAGV